MKHYIDDALDVLFEISERFKAKESDPHVYDSQSFRISYSLGAPGLMKEEIEQKATSLNNRLFKFHLKLIRPLCSQGICWCEFEIIE